MLHVVAPPPRPLPDRRHDPPWPIVLNEPGLQAGDAGYARDLACFQDRPRRVQPSKYGLAAFGTRRTVKPSAQPTLVRTQHPPQENCLVLIDDSRRCGPDRLSQRRRFAVPLVGIHRSLAAASLSPSSGSSRVIGTGECAAACRKTINPGMVTGYTRDRS
jgi:hypothetical protein